MPGWLVDPYPSGMVFPEDMEFISEIPIYRKFIDSQYFVTTVGPRFLWQEFHIKIHGVAIKQFVFLPKRMETGQFF